MSAIPDEDLSIPIPAYPSTNPQPPQQPQQHVLRSDPPPQNRNQQRLGQYNIVKTLGEGSFGKVKLAIHQTSGQKVALKIINRRKLANRDMAGRVEREIQYLQLLRHPHIIKLYSVITTPTEIIMVIEYAGGELFDYIVKHGRMDEDRSRRFFQQIICAVEYCHIHKIVHRDLKPENLLLDENLNVKIADFGLSNIMTDGNFLKTSCGSPNYAAPEVISGKLYAGPEVDVWSCGVILYVMLCGRLPFDDDYIPTLFKKIAQGTYHIPTYLSRESVALLKKMLVVNPVNRITVAEIRQDPWFLRDLPEYLWPPAQGFVDTGIDNARPVAAPNPGKQLHDDLVGKLSDKLGYGKDDLVDALERPEPSAIKDAYDILKHNHAMRKDARVSKAPPSFLAQSPPAWHAFPHSPPIHENFTPLSPSFPNRGSPSPGPPGSGGTGTPRSGVSSITSPIMKLTLGGTDGVTKDDVGAPANSLTNPNIPLNSTVSILPTSLPEYHRAFMKGGPAGAAAYQQQQASLTSSSLPIKESRRLRAVTSRASSRPDPMTPMTPAQRKNRPTKWQFGIRSRNQPLDAIACIYRALRKLGAEWLVPNPKEQEDPYDDDTSKISHKNSNTSQSDDILAPETPPGSRGRRRNSSSSESFRRDDSTDDTGDVPDDPWVIHCRWRKEGYKYNVVRPSSSNSNYSSVSRLTGAGGPDDLDDEDTVYVYMEIQLYQLESNFYLVDFKCGGYERVDVDGKLVVPKEVEDVLGELGKAGQQVNTIGGERKQSLSADPRAAMMERSRSARSTKSESGSAYSGWKSIEDKEVSSPFPFLDLAGKLIIQLAEAD